MENFDYNGDFDKEIDNGKLIIKMFLIKYKLKISNFIKHHYNFRFIINCIIKILLEDKWIIIIAIRFLIIF